jgi:dihydroceramidase
MWIMERVLRPALKAREEKRLSGSPVPTTQALVSQMWIMVVTGKTPGVLLPFDINEPVTY